jgi:hypothetical protein
MLELSLYPRASANPTSNANANHLLHNTSTSTALLAHSRRTAILTYASPMVDTANRVAQMPWYVLGVKKEAETLEVPMMERVEFAKGWRNLPGGLKLTLEKSGEGNADGVADLQVYSARVLFRARFGGLRYFQISFFTFSRSQAGSVLRLGPPPDVKHLPMQSSSNGNPPPQIKSFSTIIPTPANIFALLGT